MYGSVFSVLLKNVQGIIQCMVQDSSYYSKMLKVLFSVRFSIQRIIKKCPGYYSASGSGFSLLLKNVQGILHRLVQDSRYYSKYVQSIIQRPVQYSAYYSGYYSNYYQPIIQRLVQDSGYYSKYDKPIIQLLVQHSGYYSKYVQDII